jgi:hypothetical protein
VGIGDEGVLFALNRQHLNHKTISMNTPPAGQGEREDHPLDVRR